MAEGSFQQASWFIPQSTVRQANTALSAPSSNTEAKSSSSRPFPRRLSLSPTKATHISSGKLKGNVARRSGSKLTSLGSREGLSRNSLGTMNDPASEVTYTPTTHRISKAKKGKKVHACEHPGCTKIFTRAEHRKRHEANHNSEPLYQCSFEECRKPFQRSDLLARHMERQHNMPAEVSLSRGTRSQRSTSEPSIAEATPPRSAMLPANMGHSQQVGGQALTHAGGTMSIGSIIEPSFVSHPHPNMNDLSSMAVGVGPPGLPRDLVYTLPVSAESPLYSSDSCYSPMSDYLQPQVNSQRYLPQETVSRSHSTPVEPFYHTQLITSPLPSTSAFPVWDQFDPAMLGTPLEGSYLPTNRQYQYPSPTWMDTNGSPYEMNLPPQQPWQLAKHSPVSARSCLSDIQTVILLEAFSRHRAREAKLENIPMSSRFRALYTSLLFDEESIQMNPPAALGSLPSLMSTNALSNFRRLWIDLETKRRVLLAAFVLDSHQTALFQQRPCHTLDFNKTQLPYPHSMEIWDCIDIENWHNLLSRHQPFDMVYLGEPNTNPPSPIDAFQSSVFSCYQIHRNYDCHDPVKPQGQRPIFYSPMMRSTQTYFTHHALLLSTLAPVESLLIVSSGSWLFGTKVTENSAWISAKTTLRAWVTTKDAASSVWHAIQILRLAYSGTSLYILHEQWCLYLAALVCWAYGFVPRHLMKAIPDVITGHVAESQAWEYLTVMNVSSWEDISHVLLRGQTKGLLESVRAKISGSPGGLLNQAEDVLSRLVEGRSQLPEF